ncbi:MAG: serine/threonine-protein kinase [Verrucomicrobiales bacterium]
MSEQSKPEADSEVCPKCGVAMLDSETNGLCPVCLMASAMEPTAPDGSSSFEPPSIDVVQAAFPKLEIIEIIGVGGMGVVYKAKQTSLNREVALKLLAPRQEIAVGFAERFTREAQALAAMNHPNIVTVHDFGQADDFFYLLMEFVDGVNLRQAMQAGGFSPEEALVIVPPICDAMRCSTPTTMALCTAILSRRTCCSIGKAG